MPLTDRDLEAILRCPISGQRLRRMTEAELAGFNRMIVAGEASYPDSTPAARAISAGLVSEDGRYVYRDDEGVLFLLSEWAISSQVGKDDFVQLDEFTKSVRDFYDEVGWKRLDEGEFNDAIRYEDLRPVSSRYIHECHLRVLRYVDSDGQYMLDAGSGPIQYPEYLLYSRGYRRRICVDISLAALREAQRNLRDKGVYILADISNLPFADESMDSVVSLHTIYHIPRERQDAAIQEIHRVLAPGRRAAIVYSWKDSSLNRVLLTPLRIKRLGERILRKADLRREALIPSTTRAGRELFAEPQSYRWFITRPWDFDYQIAVWRTVSVDVLRFYIHDRLFGRQLLRILFAFEERFPGLCAAIGQYGLISIRKSEFSVPNNRRQ